jgi:DNA-binding transcriptional LysR family regulator
MRTVHEFLSTTPFDLYELFLFRLVVTHGSFTKAAEIVGLTQSAITRQIQGIEKGLGLELLERTTRSVRVTPAGAFLFQQSARLIGDVESALQRLREEFGAARKEVRLGVSRSIGLAHLPGFLHANLRQAPEVGCRVSSRSSGEILAALEAGELDLGVFSPPTRLPRTLRVTHRFDDTFTLIAPRSLAGAYQALPRSGASRTAWLRKQPWLLLEENTNTGARLRTWMDEHALSIQPLMQFDSFDLIINLVSLGMGLSFVPIRALALYGRKRTLQRLKWKPPFVRDLVVVVRQQRKIPEHLSKFVDRVLF